METLGAIESTNTIKHEVINYCGKITQLLNSTQVVNQDIEKSRNDEQEVRISNSLKQLLNYLISLRIDTYEFSCGANYASQNLEKGILPYLRVILKDYSEEKKDIKGEPSSNMAEYAFTAYYILAYMYRLYEPIELQNLLKDYEDFFVGKFALTYQIRGRLLRSQKKLGEAIQNDKLALKKLEEKNIDNISVKVTLASSISDALEAQVQKIQDKDIENSIDDVIRATQINNTYVRYYYLVAKLRLYWVRRDVYDLLQQDVNEWNNDNKWIEQLKQAEESIETAIDLLEEGTPSYPGFLVKFSIVLDRIRSLQSELQLIEGVTKFSINQNLINKCDTEKNFKAQLSSFEENIISKVSKTVNEDFNLAKETFDTEIKDIQTRYLEIMAVFVAIVGVMMTMIGLLSSNLNIKEVLLGIVTMNSSILVVYSFLKMLLSEKVTRLNVFTILFGCLLVFFSLNGGTFIPK